jgi:hypothetical protein
VFEQQVDVAIATDLDVTDPAQAREQRFAMHELVALDFHAIELRRLQGADEQVAAPFPECSAVIDDKARHGWRRRQVNHRLHDVLHVEGDAQFLAVVDGNAFVAQPL